MPYLYINDYQPLIQQDYLAQITQVTVAKRLAVERVAEAEAKSHLRQKYDVSTEFTNTAVWSNSLAYSAGNRVYLDADTYVPATAYVIGNLTLYSGNVYRCSANTTGAFDVTKWTLIAAQYTLYYVSYPKPLFSINGNYVKGEQVYWNGKVYTNIQPTVAIGHEAALQYGSYPLPSGNIFPDDPINGLAAWGTGTTYTVAAGTLPTDATKWTQGDNRDEQMVQKLVDIVLYHLHALIAPKNIPQLRIERYTGRDEHIQPGVSGTVYPVYSAIGWLQCCARGEVTPNLPLIPTTNSQQGRRIRWGGQVRNINSY